MKNEDKIIFIIIAISVAIGLFKKVNSGPTLETIEKTKTTINSSISEAEKKILDEKLDEDEKITCECGGTGYIIHGDGHKTPCPAGEDCKARKKTTSNLQAIEEIKNGTIDFYTLPGCGPCAKWKKEIKPWVEASGWKVVELESNTFAPRFEIWIKNKLYKFDGFMSKESFKEIVKNAK